VSQKPYLFAEILSKMGISGLEWVAISFAALSPRPPAAVLASVRPGRGTDASRKASGAKHLALKGRMD